MDQRSNDSAAEERMTLFAQDLPEPLQGVVNHAERFAAALAIVEKDQAGGAPTKLREPTLSETWIIGRVGEIEVVVRSVIAEWRAGVFLAKNASAAIESYLTSLHRRLEAETGKEPACCVNSESITTDYFAAGAIAAYPMEFASVAKTQPPKGLPRLPALVNATAS